MSDSRRNKARNRRSAGASVSSREARQGSTLSVPRTAAAALVVLAGIVWIALYLNLARDGDALGWMGDLGRWNFVIGFGLVFLGLALAANPGTPLGRGRGVVVGMLGCFLIGLIWIIAYYLIGGASAIPVVSTLEQYNLVVGIGFMAVGFVYATRWE